VRFSDGSPFTSNDVLATLDSYKKSGLLSFWIPNLVRWQAVDAHTVKLSFSAVNLLVPTDMEPMFVFPAKSLKAGVDLAKYDTVPGTGPYMVKSHLHGSKWTLVANPYYWGRKPGFAELDLPVIPDKGSRESALRGGTVDVAIFQDQDAANAVKSANVTLRLQRSSGYWRIHVNGVDPTSPALKDARVRQAILYALDKQTIVKLGLGGLGAPEGVVGGAFRDGCTSATDLYARQNVAKAKQLLQAAGVTSLSLSLLDSTALGSPTIAQIVQQELSQVGIKLTILEQDNATWTDNVFTKGKFDLALDGPGGFGDATALIATITPSDSPGALWKFVSSDPPLSAAIAKVKKFRPGPARTAVMHRICRLADLNASGSIGLISKPEYVGYRSDRIGKTAFPSIETVGQVLAYLYRFQPR
jgi:peptide/nickel transport system substrate-binding protein